MNIRITLASVIALLVAGGSAHAATIFLDADTPGTGSLLGTQPLVTSEGTITFTGQIRDRDEDPEFNAAGALGDVFNIDLTETAEFVFDFDVVSIEFIYGGNVGVFDITAFDIGGDPVDSFFQASTYSGEPAGPITLTGGGIRRVFWQDPGYLFAAIDNVTITTAPIPEPTAALVFGAGLALVGWSARRGMRA